MEKLAHAGNRLLPTAVNSLVKINGLQTRLTSARGLPCLGRYAWTLHWTQAGEHWWAQEVL